MNILSIFIGFIGYSFLAATFLFASFIVSNKRADIKLLLMCTFPSAAIMYIIKRMDFLHFGIRIVFFIIIFIVLEIIILKTPLYKAVSSVLLIFVALLILETIDFLLCNLFFNININTLLHSKNTTDNIIVSIAGLPINIILLISTILVYRLLSAKNILQGK